MKVKQVAQNGFQEALCFDAEMEMVVHEHHVSDNSYLLRPHLFNQIHSLILYIQRKSS